MGSNRRSATPVSIAIQNVRNAKYQTLIGFVPEDNVVSLEVMEGLLEAKDINKSSRKCIHSSKYRSSERIRLSTCSDNSFHGQTRERRWL